MGGKKEDWDESALELNAMRRCLNIVREIKDPETTRRVVRWLGLRVESDIAQLDLFPKQAAMVVQKPIETPSQPALGNVS